MKCCSEAPSVVQGWGTSGAGSGAAVLAGTTAAGGGGDPSPGPPALHAWETTGLTGAVLEGKGMWCLT